MFSATVKENLKRLKLVLERFRQFGLKIKPSKCRFLQESCTYLGHIVSGSGISADSSKIDAVQNWPFPRSEKELRSYLGLVGYY